MATITTRAGKGSPLTHAEVDANFTNINTEASAALPKAGGTMTGDISMGDSVKATFGASDDLQIYHDGSNSYIQEGGTGQLVVRAEDLRLQDANGTNWLQADTDGAVRLYHNNSRKLATTSTGIDVTGNATFADNGKAIFGAGSDLQIYHDGSDSWITEGGSGTGSLKLRANNLLAYSNSDEPYFQAVTNGAFRIYYDGSTKLSTTSTGATITGSLDVTDVATTQANLEVDPTGTAVALAIALG